MLEGLEISIIQRQEAFDPFFSARFDPEFFQKHYTNLYIKILSSKHELLGNLAFVTDGEHGNATTSSAGYAKYYGARNVTSGILSDTDVEFISETHHNKIIKSALRPRDVLISCVGANIGFAAIVPDNIGKANIVRNVALIRSSSCEFVNEYLHAYLRSCYGKALYIRMNTGNAQPLVSLDYIKTVPVFKPSMYFQVKIQEVTQLSLVFLDKAKTTYLRAETLLLEAINLADFSPCTGNTNIKTLQESFVASGRLDAEYYQPKFDELEALIKSNSLYYKRVEEIQTYNARGLQPVYFEAGTLDVINSKNILEDHLDYDNFEKTSAEYWEEQAKAQVFRDDILVYTTGANIGRTNIFQSDNKALASNHVNILRIKDENPYYVAFVMNSFIGRMQTDKLSAGSAQAELYPKDIAQFLIPFVAKEVQQQIREKVIASLALKKQSTTLLEIAKRAVEIAIEQDEQAALEYIEANQ